MIRLFTVWFDAKNSARQLEVRECVDRNQKNAEIGQVNLWHYSGDVPFNDAKIVLHPAAARPSYAELFALANRVCGPNDIAIVANTDIWFDETIDLVKGMAADTIYTLLRWEEDGRPFLLHRGGEAWTTQDTWIFRPPIHVANVDFKLGMPRCDNAIAHRIWRQGYNLQNPALSIRSHHIHTSQLRVYHHTKDRVARPWLHIEPTVLGQPGGMRMSPSKFLKFLPLKWRTVKPDAHRKNLHLPPPLPK